MTYRVIIQPRAEREIQTAARRAFTESKSRTKALRWVRTIRTKIETLKKNPRRCPVDADSEVYGEQVRVLLAGKRPGVYRVLFAIRSDEVHVLTVRHSARQSLREELEEEWQ
jgi:plasmid stabilization system protein ParE